EEDLEQLAVAHLRRVEDDLDHFGMAGAAAAHLAVARVFDVATAVAGHHLLDPVDEVEYRLQAPEAATAEDGGLEFGGGLVVGHVMAPSGVGVASRKTVRCAIHSRAEMQLRTSPRPGRPA